MFASNGSEGLASLSSWVEKEKETKYSYNINYNEYDTFCLSSLLQNEGKEAVEVVMSYYENPKLQPAICNFAAEASMWRLAVEFHRNFRIYKSLCCTENRLSLSLKSTSSKDFVNAEDYLALDKILQDINHKACGRDIFSMRKKTFKFVWLLLGWIS